MNIFSFLIRLVVKLWQNTAFIRTYLNIGTCRFYPSCSEYFLQALGKFGFFKSLFLTLKRLSKCHPFCDGGIDGVCD